ncbi:hypothetical protein RB600_004273 [Gaeumannomyces tritici]
MHVGRISTGTGIPAMRLAASWHPRFTTTCVAAVASPCLSHPPPFRLHSTLFADPERAFSPPTFATGQRWPPGPPRSNPGLGRRGFARELSSQDRPVPPAPADDHAEGYGRWKWLLLDSARALKESSPVGAFLQGRLINRPGAGKDLALWACLLNVCQRTRKEPHTSFLLEQLFRRRQLYYQEDLPLTADFWKTVLDLSLRDDRLLVQLWVYAEWMRVSHQVQWPGLYGTIMRFLLAEEELPRAFRWHVRLATNFGHDRAEFLRLLMDFSTHSNTTMQALLMSMYVVSPHRDLYDTLIPHIWNQGHSGLARYWRGILVRHNDRPKSDEAHTFIKYLSAYFPQIYLHREEKAVCSLEEETAGDGIHIGDIHTFINRVHGKTFGIKEKPYNDSMGANWFASSWVSLDTAIHLVHALGVRSIGPLSLQSIALREPTVDSLARRLEQLQTLRIDTGNSRYSAAVKHFTAQRDEETLRELLASDIHPEVYDDLATQKNILDASSRSGDWKTYRLILSVRSAEGLDHIALGFNDLILTYLHGGRRQMVLAVLAEMSSKGIPILPGTSHLISQYIVYNTKDIYDTRHDRDEFYVALGRRMMETSYPLACEAWALLLRSLGRRYKFDKLENLTMEIIRHYREADASGAHMMNVPTADVPDGFLYEYSKSLPFQRLPADLPLGNPNHPIQVLFGTKFQMSTIYRTIRFVLLYPQGLNGQDGEMASYTLGRGVKFLAELKRIGVNVNDNTVRAAVTESLVDLFGYEWTPRKPHLAMAMSRNRLPLALTREIFNQAWGAELLPQPEELAQLIDRASLRRHTRMEKKKEFFMQREARLRGLSDASLV